jgi:hypothetical protein
MDLCSFLTTGHLGRATHVHQDEEIILEKA